MEPHHLHHLRPQADQAAQRTLPNRFIVWSRAALRDKGLARRCFNDSIYSFINEICKLYPVPTLGEVTLQARDSGLG
jgi:hypothetical protein